MLCFRCVIAGMFPYDRRLLRCHPYWTQLRSPITNTDIHAKSHKQLSWVCCECDTVFVRSPDSVLISTCRCKAHLIAFKRKTRPRYVGSIPKDVTNIIRTGLLQSVCIDKLAQLVASLVGCEHSIATSHIEEVSQFGKQQLLDNGFWWEDSYTKRDGSRKKQLPITKRHKVQIRSADTEKDTEQNDDGITQYQPEKERQLTVSQDPEDHMWDDVLRAIDEDLRAFWGLWNTVILPRLDPNIPTEWEVMRVWNGDGMAITNVWDKTEKLLTQVKKLIDERQTKPGEEQIWGCLNALVTSQYPERSKTNLRSFTSRIVAFGCTPCLTYPMPVD